MRIRFFWLLGLLLIGCSRQPSQPIATNTALTQPATQGVPADPPTIQPTQLPPTIPPTQLPPTDPPTAAAPTTQSATQPIAQGNGLIVRYIDDRSDGATLITSLYNAINRKEFLRAYSYWEASDQLPAYDQFVQGYNQTKSVALTIGAVSDDAGAGQLYYSIPVTLVANNVDGTTQTFVGCYVAHLANPSIQATPPFRPLAIRSATIKQVANDADTNSLMAKSCQQS